MKQKWEVCNIHHLFNSKGVSWVNKGIPASINHLNESFPGELLPNDEVIIQSGIQFQFPKTDTLNFDMLSFGEQRIRMPENMYSKIAFIGFSTWGDYHDSILICYKDGSSQEIPFGFNDWQEFHSHDSENTSKIVMDYYRLGNEQINRQIKLEVNIIEIDSTKVLSSILLPDNDFSYIMSVSLLKSYEGEQDC